MEEQPVCILRDIPLNSKQYSSNHVVGLIHSGRYYAETIFRLKCMHPKCRIRAGLSLGLSPKCRIRLCIHVIIMQHISSSIHSISVFLLYPSVGMRYSVLT